MSNDRFKFRVWDNDENEYLQEGALIDSRTGDIAGYFPADQYTIEQCTGLTDKNGKLIYEGDVLLFNGSRNPVYFDDGSFVILHSGSVFIPIKQKYTDVFEIIGNIHEMGV